MMTIVKNHGPLIESGRINDVTYEVRGTTHPIVYAYDTATGRPIATPTQLGSMLAEDLVRMLMAEAGLETA